MITCVAAVPNPPLVVPELMGADAGQGSALRAACGRAAERLAAAAADWVAVGVAAAPATIGPSVRASFRGYGRDLQVALSADAELAGTEAAARLPLAALVAGWLRDAAGARSVRVKLLPEDASRAECELAGELLAQGGETGLLVLGDGSNRRGHRAPGGHDGRAEDFDAGVAAALGAADVDALLRIDTELATQLGARGRPAWQALAWLARRSAWRAELLYSDAPFGVGYHVALWDRV